MKGDDIQKIMGLMGLLGTSLPLSLKERILGEMLKLLEIELTADEAKQIDEIYNPVELKAPMPMSWTHAVFTCPFCHEAIKESDKAIPREEMEAALGEHAPDCLYLKYFKEALREALK